MQKQKLDRFDNLETLKLASVTKTSSMVCIDFQLQPYLSCPIASNKLI